MKSLLFRKFPLNSIKYRSASSTSHALELNLSPDLVKSFPELESVYELNKLGKYDQSLFIVERVHRVLARATGASSPPSLSLYSLMMKINFQNGHFSKIDDDIRVNGLIKSPTFTRLQLLLFSTISHLQSGAIQGALQRVDEATCICETLQTSVAMFPSCYGLEGNRLTTVSIACSQFLGLVRMYDGKYDEAESYLQMAARWSHTPTQIVTSMNNLGTLNWIMYEPSLASTPSQELQRRATNPQLNQKNFADLPISIYNNRINSNNSGAKDNLRVHHISLDYWNEAIDYINKASNNIKSQPSSCNPNLDVNDSKNDKVQNIMSSDNSVKFTSSFNSSSQKGDLSENLDEDFNSKVDFAVSYATLLCNIAEVYNTLGYLDKGSEFLTSALKTIEGFQDSHIHIVAPVLGRVLGLLAYQCMYSSQAVTAEGLFRSGLDAFEKYSHVASYDKRHSYEQAILQGRFGLLLTKWDKRETEGNKLIQRANEILSSLPQYPSTLKLSQSIIYPVILH